MRFKRSAKSVLKTDRLTRSEVVLFIALGTGIPPVCTALPFLPSLSTPSASSRLGQSPSHEASEELLSAVSLFPPVATLSYDGLRIWAGSAS